MPTNATTTPRVRSLSGPAADPAGTTLHRWAHAAATPAGARVRRSRVLRARALRSDAGSAPSSTPMISPANCPSSSCHRAVANVRSSVGVSAHRSRAAANRADGGIFPRSSGRISRSAAPGAPTSTHPMPSGASCTRTRLPGNSSTGPTRRSPRVKSTTARSPSTSNARLRCSSRRGSSERATTAGFRTASARRTANSWAESGSHQMSRSAGPRAATHTSGASGGPCHAHLAPLAVRASVTVERRATRVSATVSESMPSD